MTLANGPYGFGIVGGDAEHAYPVVARTHGHHRQGHLLGRHGLLDEQTVDHLVQSAVAADNHYASVTRVHGLHREFGHVVLVLREDELVRDLVIAYELGYLRQIVQPPPRARHGIHYDEPLERYIDLCVHPTPLRARFSACAAGNHRTWRPKRSPPSRRASGDSI